MSSGGQSSSLVHLTDDTAAAQINSQSTLKGNNYAGPASNAELSGWNVTARTGLNPGTYQPIPIPNAGASAFSKPIPIGPFSAWQRMTGQQFTANGSLNLQTGAFTRQGVNWNQAKIYAVDATVDVLAVSAVAATTTSEDEDEDE